MSQFDVLRDSSIFSHAVREKNIAKLLMFWKELNAYQRTKNDKRMNVIIEN